MGYNGSPWRKETYLRKKKYAEKLGVDIASVPDMRGKHGNHARGVTSGKYNGKQEIITSHGYVAVKVSPDHPHGWGRCTEHKYAYKHIVVMMQFIKRPLNKNEVVHHKDGNKLNNLLENLELTSLSQHAKEHAQNTRKRDSYGRFV